MANLQGFKNVATGKISNITYPGTFANPATDSATPGSKLYNFLNGDPTNAQIAKVDLSQWDIATTCGVCHIGGGHDEHDRNGMRLSQRTIQDWMMTSPPEINPMTTTVWEKYDPTTGADQSHAGMAPWIYPQYNNNDPSQGAVGAPYGWGQKTAMPNPDNPAVMMNVSSSQLMMPNVREMDCLFCHLSGYNNVMASVAIQAGSLNATPMVGAGLMDMVPISPTYQGYAASKVKLVDAPAPYAPMKMVFLNSTTMLSKINKKPASNNCMQCHATETLKDLPEMFGTIGTSSGFLSAAPTIYDPTPGRSFGPNNRRMTSYDINAPWLSDTAKSPEYSGTMGMSALMATMLNLDGTLMPQAMGPTPMNAAKFAEAGIGQYFIGGGNYGGMKGGPLFYMNPEDANGTDQNSLKRSNMPFPRSEWFKRGDTWQEGQDVHTSLGCAGCHFTGDSTHKNQCDPGRGMDNNSGIEDGVPALIDRQLVTGGELPNGEYDAGVQTPNKHDTRNTVKRCEFCHLTGKDQYGGTIDTFGAPNPTIAHAKWNLTDKMVQMVDDYSLTGAAGGFGGQGIAQTTDAAAMRAAVNQTGKGDHLDVMDCTVCHVQKKSMVVRDLDATSGARFPVVLGTDMSKGMMGLFEDPATDAANTGAVAQYNGMFSYINSFFGYTGGEAPGTNGGPGYQQLIGPGTHVIGGALKEWKPAHMWQRYGNMALPLTDAAISGDAVQPQGLSFRRKITLNNALCAILWNNTDNTIDANGDGAKGGMLKNSGIDAAPGLLNYVDIFTNEALNKNNTQGYGEPIFDPWIMHDLKGGFNFGAAGFAPISVGFGGGQYQSAYDAEFKFTENTFKYVSVWSGAVILTEPEQIAAYKTQRGATWNKTEIEYVAITPLVTHGVKKTSAYVKGKNCSDCHATGAGFFDGTMNMTGSAIPADRTYNPTDQLSSGANPLDGTGAVLDANGNYTRGGGFPALASTSNMMERPLEWIPRVKAFKDDLRTEYEDFNKLGQPRTLTFQAYDNADVDGKPTGATVYTWTKDIDRADILYPYEDGKIYCAITDDCVATPVKLMNGAEYAAYLTNMTKMNLAKTALVDNLKPVAAEIDTIATIGVTNGAGNGSTTTVDTNLNKTLGATRVNVYKGDAVALDASILGNVVGNTYTWTVNDGALSTDPGTTGYGNVRAERNIGTGSSLTNVTFGTQVYSATDVAGPGTYKVTLTVTNQLGESKTDIQNIQVIEKPVTSTNFNFTTTDTGVTTTLEFSGTLPAYDKVKIAWGDGTGETITGALGTTLNHNYKRLLSYAWNGTTKTTALTQAGITMYKYPTKFYFYKNVTATSSKLVASKLDNTVEVGLLSDLVTKVRVTKVPTNGVYNVRKGTDTIIVITVTNKGPNNNSNILVTVPSVAAQGLTEVLVTPSKVSITPLVETTYASGVWTIPSLAKGKSAYLAIRVTVPTTATGNITYTVPVGAIAVGGGGLPDMTANPAVPVTIHPVGP